MNETRVGLLGWGVVGAGTARLLTEDADLIRERLGWPLVLKRIADLDITRPRPGRVDPGILTTDAGQVLHDPEIEIVIELIGGLEPARTFMLQAIKAGKHVVTANKALLATHGPEIFAAAQEYGVDVLFEASVGGVHPHHPRAQGRADSQPHPALLRHPQRHGQLHPDQDER
jgi:homoserine dehydrogenase